MCVTRRAYNRAGIMDGAPYVYRKCIWHSHKSYGLFPDWEEKKDAEKRARYAPVVDFFNSLSENLGWKLMQFNFTVGVRGSISNVDRTEPLSFLSTLRALGITSKANLEKIRKVTAKRAFEAHDLLLRSYYAAKSSPSRTDFSDIAGNIFALQHRLRPSKSRSR